MLAMRVWRTRQTPRCTLLLKGGSRGVSWASWMEEVDLALQKNKVLLRGAMVRRRPGPHIPYVGVLPDWTLSNLFGHASFGFLALAYVSQDALMLRGFAVGGVSCAVIFQYYREKPLWLPIRWNALFLAINLGMIAVLLSDEADALNIPPDQKMVYEAVFRSRGMTPTDFVRLMRVSERKVVQRGSVLVSSDKESSHLYLLQGGRLTVRDKKGKIVDELLQGQFAGALSFLAFEQSGALRQHLKAKREAQKAFRDSSSDNVSHSPIISPAKLGADTGVGDARSQPPTRAVFHHGLAEVIAEETCVVYSFPFDAVAELVEGSSALGRALERCLSADLSKKMLNRNNRHHQF